MEIEVANDTDSCSSGGCGGGSGDVAGAAYLVWQDLTVVIPNTRDGRPRTILRGLTGLAEPGKITAVMGPSGSGKSTFLDSLADRLSANVVMTGNVLLNGKKMRRDRGLIAYVTQENILLGTLTVRETITYSAHLRFPSTLSNAEVDGIVEETIIAMGLQDCADRLVGNWHLRGVSGGEKKRLSIAIEILTRPQLLFLDEPTSGLDSAASFFVVQILRNLAMDGGRTIITSIHQPSSETFSLFDDLFLLSAGETVYFGGAKTAIEFFAEAGYPCPSRRSPSDHFLRCINSDFDKVTAVLMGKHDMQTSSDPLINVETAQIKATLVEKYRWSEYAVRVRAKIQEIESIEGLPTETKRVSQATWWKQLSTLSRRSFKNMCRDVGYYWARLGVYIIVAVCVGTIFYHVGTTYAAISARGAYGAFMVGFMVFMSIGGFPSFVEELKVFNRERDGGCYGSGVYVLSNMLSSMPLLVLLTMASSSICYYMVEFRPEFSHFVYSCLMLFACISAVESSMMVVASLVSNYLLGLLIGAGVIVIMMMNSGNSRLLPDLHKPLRRYLISYISLGCWALQGWYKNDLLGLEFDTIDPGKPKLKGADIIRDLYGIRLDHSKWWDLAAVYMIFISYRIIFFLVLEFKQRTSLVFQKLNTKKAWHSLKKRPLFQMPAFPSKRYQPQQSLYSQGLSSPIS